MGTGLTRLTLGKSILPGSPIVNLHDTNRNTNKIASWHTYSLGTVMPLCVFVFHQWNIICKLCARERNTTKADNRLSGNTSRENFNSFLLMFLIPLMPVPGWKWTYTSTATLNVTLHSKCQLIKILIAWRFSERICMSTHLQLFFLQRRFDSQQRLNFLYASHTFQVGEIG